MKRTVQRVGITAAAAALAVAGLTALTMGTAQAGPSHDDWPHHDHDDLIDIDILDDDWDDDGLIDLDIL